MSLLKQRIRPIHPFQPLQSGSILLPLLLCLIICKTTASAQVSLDSTLTGRQVIAIEVHGNEKTKSFVVLREMKQKTGNPFNPALVREDWKRILNLFLFTRVIIFSEEHPDGVVLRIIVSERWYIFPFPILYINDRDWSKFSYGAGILHANFRGRNEQINASLWFGYNPGLVLQYQNPWFGGERKLFTTLSLSLNHIRSKHFEEAVDEEHQAFGCIFGKQFGYHTRLSFKLNLRQVMFDRSVPGAVLSPDGRDRFVTVGTAFLWDRRDLIEYPHRGWLLGVTAAKMGIPGGIVDYGRVGWDMRGYLPIFYGGTLALRWKSELSMGTIPSYDKLYLGYSERVRGHFFNVIEGEIRSLVSAELRFTILPVRYFRYAVSSYFRDLKFGVSGGVFLDAGYCADQADAFSMDRIISGFGIGLHFHLPYVNLLRLEWAWNEEGRGQAIADLYVNF